MAYDETDVYQDGTGGEEVPYDQNNDAMFTFEGGQPPYNGAQPGVFEQEAPDDAHASGHYAEGYDPANDYINAGYDGMLYADDSAVGEAYAPQNDYAPGDGFVAEQVSVDGVASVGDLLADGSLLNDQPAEDDATAAVQPVSLTGDVGVVFSSGAPDTTPSVIAGDGQLDATTRLQSDGGATAGAQADGVAARDDIPDIDDFPIDSSVDLLPNTQVIQPASSVSSISGLSYDEDADSKAAVAALQARRKKRRRTRILRIALVCVVVIAGIAIFALSRGMLGADDEVVVEAPATVQVVREDFVSTITSQGSLKPVEATTVTAEVEGTLTDMLVAEGDTVNEGDVLFTIKNEALDKALADANNQLTSANTALSTRETAVRTAYNAYNSGVDAYNAGDASIDVATLRSAIVAAEAARDDASAAVTTARDAVNAAQDAVDKCTVKSPRSGTVVAINSQSSSGAPVSVEVADVSQLKATVQVNEMDISLVEVGQEATFTFSALPDVRLTGMVDSIASMATGAEEASYGGVVTFGVTLIIPLPDPQLKPGMTATATILTENVPDALVLPLTAVSIDPDEPSVGTVNVVRDLSTYATETRTVTLGARSSTEVVVTEGLSEGDLVTLSGYDIVLDASADSADTAMVG